MPDPDLPQPGGEKRVAVIDNARAFKRPLRESIGAPLLISDAKSKTEYVERDLISNEALIRGPTIKRLNYRTSLVVAKIDGNLFSASSSSFSVDSIFLRDRTDNFLV